MNHFRQLDNLPDFIDYSKTTFPKKNKLKNWKIFSIVFVFFLFISSAFYISDLLKTNKEKLESKNPSVLAVVSPQPIIIGKSAGGRDIIAYKIGNGSKHIAIIGGMNGLPEEAGIKMVQSALEFFSETNAFPNNLTVYFIPQINIDSSFDSGDWNGNGKDINRDFTSNTVPGGSHNSWACSTIRYCTQTDSTTLTGGCSNQAIKSVFSYYCGKYPDKSDFCCSQLRTETQPFSQPETRSLRDFILNNNISTVLSFRAPINNVTSSNDETGKLPETEDLVRLYAATLASFPGYSSNFRGYEEYFSDYPVNGQFMDWLQDIGVSAVEIELPEARNLDNPTKQGNLSGIQTILRWLSISDTFGNEQSNVIISSTTSNSIGLSWSERAQAMTSTNILGVSIAQSQNSNPYLVKYWEAVRGKDLYEQGGNCIYSQDGKLYDEKRPNVNQSPLSVSNDPNDAGVDCFKGICTNDPNSTDPNKQLCSFNHNCEFIPGKSLVSLTQCPLEPTDGVKELNALGNNTTVEGLNPDTSYIFSVYNSFAANSAENPSLMNKSLVSLQNVLGIKTAEVSTEPLGTTAGKTQPAGNLAAAGAAGGAADIFGTIPHPKELDSLFVGQTGDTGLGIALSGIIELIYIIAAVIFIFFLLWSALEFIYSRGDKEHIQSARGRLTWAIVGLILLSLSFVIMKIIGTIVNFRFFN